MSDSLASRRLRRFLVALTIAIPVGAVVLFQLRDRLEARRWETVFARADRWEQEFEALDRTRSVLTGTAIEGDAWPLYLEALAEARTAYPAGHMLSLTHPQTGEAQDVHICEALGEDPWCSLPAVRAVATGLGPTLETLREASRRTRGGALLDWSRGPRVGLPSLMATRLLLFAQLNEATAKQRAGDAVAAQQEWLTLVQFGRDLTHSRSQITQVVGYVVLNEACDWIAERNVWADLPLQRARSLAGLLDGVDMEPRSGPTCIQTDGLLVVRAVDRQHPSHSMLNQLLEDQGLWRYGGSLAAVLDEYTAVIEDADARLRALGPLRNATTTRAALDPLLHHSNPLVHLGTLFSSDDSRAGTRARLRVLRGALAVAAGLEPTALPTAQRLRARPAGDGYLVSCADGETSLVVRVPRR